MSKDIELFEISDKNQPVGTEIFDANMPSNIDFEEQVQPNGEKVEYEPDKKVPEMGKVITIGDQLKSFNVKGKVTAHLQPKYANGTTVNVSLNTQTVKMEDEEVGGLKKLWSSIVGHTKREILVQDGFIYFLQKQKQGFNVRSTISLANLFKVFVDPQQERIRLVVKQEEHLANRDLFPANFIVLTEQIQHQLQKIGLSLV